MCSGVLNGFHRAWRWTLLRVLMKPLQLVTTPTRNRRLNELIGLLALTAAILLFLSLVSYRPTDPSWNTVGGFGTGARPAHNWIGLIGASLADLLLQFEGVTAFCLPLVVGALGWAWLRSRTTGSAGAKLAGLALCLIFGPALAGLVPGRLHFLHGLPIPGVVGMLVSGALVAWLNQAGAWLVAVCAVMAAVYLLTTFSLNTAREWMSVRFAFVLAWRDRWQNWRFKRARAKEARAEAKAEKLHEKELEKERRIAAKLGRREANANAREAEPVANTPAVVLRDDADSDGPKRRGGFAEIYAEEPPPQTVWEQMPRAVVPDPEPEPVAETPAPVPTPKPQLVAREQKPERAIAVGERAAAEPQSVTVAPKSMNGFRLPASTLLHRSD